MEGRLALVMEIVKQTLLDGKVGDDRTRTPALNDETLCHVVKEVLLDEDHR